MNKNVHFMNTTVEIYMIYYAMSPVRTIKKLQRNKPFEILLFILNFLY